MSNILYIRVVESRTLDEDFIRYEIQASDSYEDVLFNSYDSLAKLYQAFPSNEMLAKSISMLEEFEGLTYSVGENDSIEVDVDAPYSAVVIEGFHPGVAFACEAGHPLMYLANNRVRTSLLFASDTDREVNTQEVERDERIVCNNPDCEAHIHPAARQRVLEEGRSYHRTDPTHR